MEGAAPGARAQRPSVCSRHLPMTLRIVGPAGALHVDDGGEGGVPVVFVHSFGGSTAHWPAQLAHLRKSRRALALDVRGHGQSAPAADNDYAIESLAADVATVVDGLDLSRFVLVGHGLGSSVVVAYAAAHPERVAGLLLVTPPGKVAPKQAHQTMAAMESDFDNVSRGYFNKLLTGAQPAVRSQITIEMGSLPKDASLGIIKSSKNYDALPALRSYPGAKLSIVTPQNDAPNELHNLLPELPHTSIEGTSHWLHMDKPEEFNRLLDEFLARIP